MEYALNTKGITVQMDFGTLLFINQEKLIVVLGLFNSFLRISRNFVSTFCRGFV